MLFAGRLRQENSSREFNREQIRTMIQHQQSVYNWQFLFLAANQDAFAEGVSLGIASAGIAQYSPDKVHGTYAAAAANVSRMRQSRSVGDEVDNRFTEDEKQAMQ